MPILSIGLLAERGYAQTDIAVPYDIIINEMMPDPAPQVSLPNSEYIELYNRSTKTINLLGFKIYNGTVSTELPNFILKSKSHVIIYTRKSGIDFGIYGDTLPVSKLVTLSNPNDTFYLKSSNNIIIDAAFYDLSFYQNSKKSDGGWSLERIKIGSPCSTENWIASNDLKGGTPGQRNSVATEVMDKTPPQILNAYVKDEKTLVLRFDKAMNRDLLKSSAQYQLIPEALSFKISSSNVSEPFFNSTQISLNQPLQKGVKYNLVIKNTLTDCLNNAPSKNDTVVIQLPEKPTANDLIINELLFNPEVGGSRFIEIYNRSEKVIDLINIKIADLKKQDVKTITSNFMLFPKKYVVLTEYPLYIQSRYKVKDLKKSFIKNSLPTWNDSEGNASIYSVEGSKTVVIDSFNYKKAFHNPLLANTEGVSLERLNPENATNNIANWHSSASSVGYASPAFQNSQYQATPSVSAAEKDIFTLPFKTFSPNDDGFQDYLLLLYDVDKPDFMCNIAIYDIEGRLVKKLISNELLASKSQIKWEGETDEKLKAPTGTYIIYIELISPQGEVKRLKKVCVLTDSF